MQTVTHGQVFRHRGISLHRRIRTNGEPPTVWLTITAPWKAIVYDLSMDEMVRRRPRYAFGFRYWGPF